ncbi:MAG: addiction module toxin, HicA family [Ignavibacteriae bacterium]|nr:addiction module toxin, HicA family [Ignavibacteriota bacterium]NOG96559.1 addiction module toxin, HicA family [Ignavibacteriota bacterium]
MGEINSIKNRTYRKYLESIGCNFARQKGSHVIYKKKGCRRPIIFQHKGDIPILHIFTNLKTLGITKEEFLEDIKKIR